MSTVKTQLFFFMAALLAVLIIYGLVDYGGVGSLNHKVWL